jgi:hypothetical protein
MSKHYPDTWIQKLVESAARLAWADWWANQQEERGRRFAPRTDLYDAAPPTPEYAKVWAGMMVGHVEAANHLNIYSIGFLAHKADTGDDDGNVDPEKFGVALAFMALGHGVSWFDDHAKFPLKMPHLEFDAG